MIRRGRGNSGQRLTLRGGQHPRGEVVRQTPCAADLQARSHRAARRTSDGPGRRWPAGVRRGLARSAVKFAVEVGAQQFVGRRA